MSAMPADKKFNRIICSRCLLKEGVNNEIHQIKALFREEQKKIDKSLLFILAL